MEYHHAAVPQKWGTVFVLDGFNKRVLIFLMNYNFLTRAIEFVAMQEPLPEWSKTIERNTFNISEKIWLEMKSLMDSYLNSEVEKIRNVNNGKIETAYKICGIADYNSKVTDLLVNQGIAFESDFHFSTTGGQTTDRILRMIFHAYCEFSRESKTWQANMSDPDFLKRNPAARFVRFDPDDEPNPLHKANENKVYKWDDPFWLHMNNKQIGGFEVPWGPFGFESYMTQRPVKREEAERLGIVKKGEPIKRPDVKRFGFELNERIEDDLDDVSEELKAKARAHIIEVLGPQAIDKNGNPTLDAYKQALNRIR